MCFHFPVWNIWLWDCSNRKSEQAMGSLSYNTLKFRLEIISSILCQTVIRYYMHAITTAHNVRHIVDLRRQEILIEIELDKLLVMKYIINGWTRSWRPKRARPWNREINMNNITIHSTLLRFFFFWNTELWRANFKNLPFTVQTSSKQFTIVIEVREAVNNQKKILLHGYK